MHKKSTSPFRFPSSLPGTRARACAMQQNNQARDAASRLRESAGKFAQSARGSRGLKVMASMEGRRRKGGEEIPRQRVLPLTRRQRPR